MFWAAVLLVMCVFFCITAGYSIGKGESAVSVFMVCLLAIFGGVGITLIYLSAQGNITHAYFMPSQPIYSVDGQVVTSLGKVAVIEDGQNNVYAVWAGNEDDEKSRLPSGTKMVRVKFISGTGYCFVPFSAPENSASK